MDPRIASLHPEIQEVSAALFEDRHLAQAIFEAYKAVEVRVKKLGGLDATGRPLMSAAFKPDEPTLIVGDQNWDEQEGFMLLFMGAMQGIRNPKAHNNIVQDDPDRAVDYLSFASLLMRRLDDAEARLIQED